MSAVAAKEASPVPETAPRPDVAPEVIRAALEVHRTLGSGLCLEMYQRALELELEDRCVRFWHDVSVDLFYKGRRLGRSQVPIVADEILVGICVEHSVSAGEVARLAAQARSLDCDGLLLNFGAERLEIRRIRRPPRDSP